MKKQIRDGPWNIMVVITEGRSRAEKIYIEIHHSMDGYWEADSIVQFQSDVLSRNTECIVHILHPFQLIDTS